MKKTKKVNQKVEIELSINDNTKSLEIQILRQFLSLSEQNCGVY